MPPVADQRISRNVMDPTLGYCFSPNLQGKYIVEDVENLPEIYNIRIKATDAAKDAYERPDRFEVILNIIDGDENKTDWIPREIIYNFPREFGKDEIELDGPKVIARFKLKKISPAEN